MSQLIPWIPAPCRTAKPLKSKTKLHCPMRNRYYPKVSLGVSLAIRYSRLVRKLNRPIHSDNLGNAEISAKTMTKKIGKREEPNEVFTDLEKAKNRYERAEKLLKESLSLISNLEIIIKGLSTYYVSTHPHTLVHIRSCS